MSWYVIRASAHDHPNVQEGREVIPGGPSRAWVEDVRDEYGEDSPYYIARVEARFPTSSSDAAFPLALVERAMDAHTSASERLAGLDLQASGEPWTIGVDVAGDGMTGDETVVALRRGPVVYELRAWRGLDTMETVQRVVEIWEELDRDSRARVREIVVDSIGIGKGVFNRLEETHVTQRRLIGHTRFGRPKWRSTSVKGFDARKSAVGKGDYRNRRSQAYWWLREKLEDGEILLPYDEALFEELTRMPYRIDQKGKVWFKKDDLKTRIGRSPDRADAVVISLWPAVRRVAGKRVWFV